ncbi:protein NRT1/ PTR FAMILY 7.3-like [Vitis vinifera]|uniref:protein NRT1/ PTR FAMILY 7.3-like n=1 Tax=Vitis vinifera TaxID=29760 RepID=UPI002882EC32|nr:protein NRT1/ PTR FAMILY 7.3-like [Vitis vinifera]
MGFCMGVFELQQSGNGEEGLWPAYTKDGLLDRYGKPAVRGRTGGWKSGLFLLVNQGLGTLAFYGVEANMIPFSKTVMRQTNAEAGDTFSRWMGAVYLFSLIAAFLSDSYLGRYLTWVIFQVVLTIVRNGASEPAFATFGADQFDEEDPEEKQSKTSFYSYFYVALSIGCLFSGTVLLYMESMGNFSLGFWISTSCAIVAFVLLLSGTRRYRHFKPSGNPVSRIAQVIVASLRKRNLQVPSHGGGGLHEVYGRKGETSRMRRILHTDDFVFLNQAAIITPEDSVLISDPWHICPITQVEEMLSLFVEQGAAMDRTFLHFQVPPASMTVFDIVSTSIFTVFYDKLFIPLYLKLTKKEPKTLTELQRIGIGLAIAVVAMLASGLVEQQRLKYSDGSKKEMSSLSIFWQTPQYILVGVSGAFVYVAQMEFFTSQTPDGLKSLGIGLSMSSSAFGSYICSIILGLVMKITTRNGKPGWVPPNLNDSHLDRFFFLSAALSMLNLGLFVVCSNRYKCISLEER